MGFCKSFISGMFVQVNIVLFLCGATIGGVGIWMLVGSEDYNHIFPAYNTPAYIVIGLGFFLFLVGSLGCCGALYDSRCMLGLYIAFLVLVTIAEISAGVIYAVNKDDVDNMFLNIIKNKYQDEKFSKYVDGIQEKLKCCGSAGPQDYDDSKWKKAKDTKDKQKIPESCCKPGADKTECTQKSDNSTYYTTGCKDRVIKKFKDHEIAFIVSASVLGVLQIGSLVCAIVFLRQLKPDYEVY